MVMANNGDTRLMVSGEEACLCRLCGHMARFRYRKLILNAYNISYFQCDHCCCLQTEDPYWLEEAYGNYAERYDTGKATRTLDNFLSLPSLFDELGINKEMCCVDWGGGSGLLARLLRDVGYNVYSYDKYSTSEFSQGFMWPEQQQNVSAITAFEVVEHFSNPNMEWNELLKLAPDTVILTTVLYCGQDANWDYLSPENGQHVFFYSKAGIALIAASYGYCAYTVGPYIILSKSSLGSSSIAQLAKWAGNIAESKRQLFERWLSQRYIFARRDQEKIRSMIVSRCDRPIAIDMVFFQINRSGIARVWESLLREWAKTDYGARLILIDRAKTAPRIAGLRYVDAAPHDYSNMEMDRVMLQRICDQNGIVLFISTYYSSPLTTPSLMMVYDMIPEVLSWDLMHPMWREKHTAIMSACKFVCISESTASDLNKYYSISRDKVVVARTGVSSRFHPASDDEIKSFKDKYGIMQEYYITAGERGAYKNIKLFFSGLAKLKNRKRYQVLCLGGRPELEPELSALLIDVPVAMLRVSDDELRCAYAGAVALVYPSLYEGFGMPIIEAMACGCPVVTCRGGAIPEVAGEDVIYVGCDSVNEMTLALQQVQENDVRSSLIQAGLLRAKKYSWPKMAGIMRATIENTIKAIFD